MATSGGDVAAKRARFSIAGGGTGEDRLSALPDDVLVLILLSLGSAAAAGRTSVLSSRWRRLWALLPELLFPSASAAHLVAVASAIDSHSHDAALRHLLVEVDKAAPDTVAALLRAAARRLSGELVFRNRVPAEDPDAAAGKTGAFEMPCFGDATSVSLDLGFLGLAMPAAGEFSRLTELSLNDVWLNGSCELGEAISSTRCPCLRKLSVSYSNVQANLAIHSESLTDLVLRCLDGLRRLTIVAPVLQNFRLMCCFTDHQRQPVADISTPELVLLTWIDRYDPSSVQLGDLTQLQTLTIMYIVYGTHDTHDYWLNLGSILLLKRFTFISTIEIALFYHQHNGNHQYLMEEFTVLPRSNILALHLFNTTGHAIGASLFHMLRMSTGIQEMALVLYPKSNMEVQLGCEPGCICDEPSNWKTEEFTLNNLQEVSIIDMHGNEHEDAFVKQLIYWAVNLKTMRLLYDSISLGKEAVEVHEKVISFAMPETWVTLEELPHVG